MKKQLINEVKRFQKIAGILKEYIESDPETITQAFQIAGIDLNKPVFYIVDAGRGPADKPVKMLGGQLLKKLEAERAKGEAANPEYNEEEGVTYDFEPAEVDPDLQPAEVRNIAPKLYVQFSDLLLYEIYQADEMNELHPDDPASVDLDDIEDEDPEDFDDLSERKKGDLSDYVVKNDDGKFYIDQEDPDTGEVVASPGDSFVFTYEGRQYKATVTNKDFGRNGVYLLRLAGDDNDVMEDINEVNQKVLKAIEAYVDSKLGVVGTSEVVKKAINHIVAAYEKEKPTRELGAFIKNHFDDYAGRNIAYSELL